MFASKNISRPRPSSTQNQGKKVDIDSEQSSCDVKEMKKDYSRLKKCKEKPSLYKVAYIIDDKLLEAVERIPSYGIRVSCFQYATVYGQTILFMTCIYSLR